MTIEILTLADQIESDWLGELALMRKNGWTVAVHNDYRDSGVQKTFWLFTHPDGQWVKGEASSDAMAVYEAFCQTKLGFPTATTCSRCGGSLQPYSSGLACFSCPLFLEKNRWWRICCDEAHQHAYRCLIPDDR